MIPILISVVAIGFLLIQLAPGDILAAFRLNPDVRPETVERMERMFGLNKPWYVQFFKYIWNALHGEFGFSQTYKAPVFTLVNQRAGNTLILAFASLLMAWGFSIPAGIVSATHQYRWQDQILSVLAFVGLSIPNFFLGFLLIYLITNTGGWLPIGGMWSINSSEMNVLQKAVDLLKHLIVPTIVLATAAMAQLTRLMRANMLEIMGQQYVTTARAKGLRERIVINRHALRNAVNPLVSSFGVMLPMVLMNSIIVAALFDLPSFAQFLLEFVQYQDQHVVTAALLFYGTFLILGNLIADIALAAIDPRIRMT